MTRNSRSADREAVLRRVLAEGWITDESPSVLLVDLDQLRERVTALRAAFPDALHTVAVKALPLPRLLAVPLSMGLGLEVASPGEMALARHLDVPPDRVVFDSPAKTQREIDDALRFGCRLHVDNLQELDRVAASSVRPRRHVGVRLNPGLEGARIPETFIGGPKSKFGVDLDRHRDALLRHFAENDWLDGVHVHVGSQGCALELLVAGVARVAAFVEELAERGVPPRTVDIGGGLPVTYGAGDAAATFEEYAAALRAAAPSLFVGDHQLVTEFGRSLLAPCGWAATRVEYTRPGLTERTAVVHLGADMFVRVVYRPDQWQHAIEVHDPSGHRKRGMEAPWSIAGPLCFSADYLAVARPLPPIEPGDVIVVRDAGAYTLGMWSKYNSRLAPPVLGYDADGTLRVLKPAETVDDLLRFWGTDG